LQQHVSGADHRGARSTVNELLALHFVPPSGTKIRGGQPLSLSRMANILKFYSHALTPAHIASYTDVAFPGRMLFR
jgi:hypothetical protein